MLTSLVTRLERSTRYSSIRRLTHPRSLQNHAAVRLQSPAEQDPVTSQSLHTGLCDPAVRRRSCVQVPGVGSLPVICAAAISAMAYAPECLMHRHQQLCTYVNQYAETTSYKLRRARKFGQLSKTGAFQ